MSDYWMIYYIKTPYDITVKPFATAIGADDMVCQASPLFHSKQRAEQYLQREATSGETKDGDYEIVRVSILEQERLVFQHDPEGIDLGMIELRFTGALHDERPDKNC